MTSEPPPASSWAAAPEFYTDENSGTRAVRRLLLRLGYTVHTPAELYGARTTAEGAPDEDWLAKVGTRGWTVIGRDVKIYERPAELASYRQARIHVFLLPGQAIVTELVHLIEVNLTDICTSPAADSPAHGASRREAQCPTTSPGHRRLPSAALVASLRGRSMTIRATRAYARGCPHPR